MAMKRVEFCGGVAMAVFAAGPIFIMSWIVLRLFYQPPNTLADFQDIFLALVAVPIAIPLGALISLIPTLVGGTVMALLGARHPTTRRPLVWAFAGASLSALILAPFNSILQPAAAGMFIWFGVIGAICALIVRYGTRWSDDST